MENNRFNYLEILLMAYLDMAINIKAPKCYIKDTMQEYSGQIYFTEKVGLHDGKGYQIEYR